MVYSIREGNGRESNGNVYNVDETGNSLGTMERAHAVVDATQNTQYQGQPGRQEWVTAIHGLTGLRAGPDPFDLGTRRAHVWARHGTFGT